MADFDDFTVFNADVLKSLYVNDAAIAALRAGVEEGVHTGADALDGRLTLIGLMADEANLAVKTVRHLGETPERIRFAARGLTQAPPFSEPPHLTPDIPLSIAEEVRQMFRLAGDEARRLGPWKAVGPEHLLLAMTRDDEQSVNPLLKGMGLTLERARRAVRAILGFPE
jgi:ATP-dependent Clp protease ATP-binding subunit ClpA